MDITENKQQLLSWEKTHTFVQQVTNHYYPLPSHPTNKGSFTSKALDQSPCFFFANLLKGRLTQAIHWCSSSTNIILDIKKPSTFFGTVAMISRSFLFILYFAVFVGSPKQRMSGLKQVEELSVTRRKEPWPSFVNSLQNEAIGILQPREVLLQGHCGIVFWSCLYWCFNA